MYVFDEEKNEIQKNKKKVLQEQFLKKMKSKKKVAAASSQSTVTKIDADTRLKAEKKKRKLLEKQNKLQLKKNEEQRMELQKLKMNLRTEKNAAIELQFQLKQMNESLKKETNELQKSLLTIEKLNKQNARLVKMWEKRQTNKEKKKIKTNAQLLVSVQNMKIEIRSLKKQLQTNNVVVQAEKNIRQAELVNQLSKKNIQYKNRLKKYNDFMTPEFLLELLEEELNKKEASVNFISSLKQIGKIADKLKQLKVKMITEQKARDKFKQSPGTEIEFIVSNDDIRTGYLTKKEKIWYFVNVHESSNDHYEISTNRSGLKFVEEQPVKVKIVNGKAVVLRMYLEIPERESQLKKIEKIENLKIVKEEEEEMIVYPYFGDYNVLVVGSQRMNQYKERLTKHGLKVELHNPFEEHESRMKPKADRADVVIVCTSHVSHAVLDHLDLHMKKVELIENDTEENIATRTRFSLINLNLIKVH